MSFAGRDNGVERFSVRLTFPDPGDDETPPTQRQHDVVVDYFGQGPETQRQADFMISARFYADEVVQNHGRYNAHAVELLRRGAAAYILSHPEIREKVTAWSGFRWRNPTQAVVIERTMSYRPTLQFGEDLIADLRDQGSQLFAPRR
jgi:hypothetical protein